MNSNTYFGFGVFLSGIVWFQIRTPHGIISTGSLVLVFGYALLGLFCYSVSAKGSQHLVSRTLAFFFGVAAMCIQCLVNVYVIASSEDASGFKSAAELSDALPTSRLVILCAWFLIPIIVCSVVARRIAQRSSG